MSEPKDIVPDHCTGSVFVFEPGAFHLKKDGSATLVIAEDDFELEDDRGEGPDGPEGSIHWLARLAPCEVIALRDFLNGDHHSRQETLG